MSKIALIKVRGRLKREIQFASMMEILKEIAVSEYQFMEKRRREAHIFTETLESFFAFYRLYKFRGHIFLENNTPGRALAVVSSDEGFLGLLTNQLVESAITYTAKYPGTRVVAVGKKGATKLEEAGVHPDVVLPSATVPLSYESVQPLRTLLLADMLSGRIGTVAVAYPKSLSFSRQVAVLEEILPFHLPPGFETLPEKDWGQVVIEPNESAAVEYAIALWFGRKFYEIFWESKLAEAASRTIELNERHESLTRSVAKIRVRYFRACHEVVDAGIREVFSSQHFARKFQRQRARQAGEA